MRLIKTGCGKDSNNMFLGWWAVLCFKTGVVFHAGGLHIGVPPQADTVGCELCHVAINEVV
jgi:hypothetical protein